MRHSLSLMINSRIVAPSIHASGIGLFLWNTHDTGMMLVGYFWRSSDDYESDTNFGDKLPKMIGSNYEIMIADLRLTQKLKGSNMAIML